MLSGSDDPGTRHRPYIQRALSQRRLFDRGDDRGAGEPHRARAASLRTAATERARAVYDRRRSSGETSTADAFYAAPLIPLVPRQQLERRASSASSSSSPRRGGSRSMSRSRRPTYTSWPANSSSTRRRPRREFRHDRSQLPLLRDIAMGSVIDGQWRNERRRSADRRGCLRAPADHSSAK